MSDRLQEIRARLDLPGVWAAGGPQNREFIDHAVGDIAWLLGEVERLRNTSLSAANPLCDGGDA